MSRINYSKWDKLSEYDDLSDDDNAEVSSVPFSQGPRVTRLDQPSTVTRTATGEIVIHDATVVAGDEVSEPAKRSREEKGRHDSVPFPDSGETVLFQALPKTGDKDIHLPPQASSQVPSHWTEKGGSCEYQGTTVYWSQDRSSVTLRVRLPGDDCTTRRPVTNAQYGRYVCTVSNMLSYSRRDSAVSQERCRLRISDRGERSGTVVLDGELPHVVHANQDDNDDEGGDYDQVDWVIERLDDGIEGVNTTKYIEISLNKASPMSGVTLWWKQPFLDAPEIDLENASASTASTQAFASAWKDAHEQFKGTIKRQKAGVQLELSQGGIDQQE